MEEFQRCLEMTVIVGKLAVSTLGGWIGKHVWLPLVGSKLEAGANTKEPDTDQIPTVLG